MIRRFVYSVNGFTPSFWRAILVQPFGEFGAGSSEIMTRQIRFDHPLLPKSIRGLIIGKSGCGKTTLLLNLLLCPGWLDYNNISVFGKSLFQPEYRILKKAFEEKLPKEAIMRLFDYRDEVIKLGISPSALIEDWAK